MFFSKDNWNNGQEMNAVIPVSSALSFEKVYSSLQAADELYLIPVFGSALMATFRSIYDKEDKSEDEKQLLQELQTAEANLAYYTNFDALQLRITDQGFQRQQTENFGSPYKYQEDRLRHTFKIRGFNAIDSILDLLDAKFVELEGYAEMPVHATTRTDIVQRTAEVNRVHFINNSRLVFLRLVPILTAISYNELRPLLGWQLYTKMLKALNAGTAKDEVPAASASGDPSRTYEELRQQCIPFVVKKAVAQLLRETGSITDRGLYFIGQAAGSSDNQTATPATRREAHDAAAIAEAEAQRNADTLLAFIEWKWPEYFSGHQSDVFKRNNNDKKTFWA